MLFVPPLLPVCKSFCIVRAFVLIRLVGRVFVDKTSMGGAVDIYIDIYVHITEAAIGSRLVD